MASLPVGFQLGEIPVGQIVGYVGVAAFEQGAPVAGVGHHAQMIAPDLGSGRPSNSRCAEDDWEPGGPVVTL